MTAFGLSFGYGLQHPSLQGAANTLSLAGGHTHLAYAAPYFIAPNRIPVRAGMHGLGLDDSTKKLVLSAPSIVGGILTSGGSSSIAASQWGMAAGPIIGGIVMGVTIALSLLLNRKGPAQKIATSNMVNAIESGWTGDDGIRHPGLKDNLIGYFQGPRTVSSRLQALANFDAAWGYVVSNCNTAKMGAPGQRCVSDRQSGACVWKRGPGDPMEQYDGVKPGECWNWFNGYRDPIERDIPNPDPTITSEAAGAIDDLVKSLGIGGGNTNVYLFAGGALILLAAIVGGGK